MDNWSIEAYADAPYPTFTSHRGCMRHTNQTFKSQLELSLPNSCAGRVCRRPRRSERARWWFDRMRQLVEGTAEFKEPTKPTR